MTYFVTILIWHLDHLGNICFLSNSRVLTIEKWVFCTEQTLKLKTEDLKLFVEWTVFLTVWESKSFESTRQRYILLALLLLVRVTIGSFG